MDGRVELSNRTTFPWTDGCQWATEQRIHGELGTGTLSYSYVEGPLEGQMDCARPCTATARFFVWP